LAFTRSLAMTASMVVAGTLSVTGTLDRTGLRRDFPPEGPPQASDLGKLWITPDFLARM
jgi:hypothetical protein